MRKTTHGLVGCQCPKGSDIRFCLGTPTHKPANQGTLRQLFGEMNKDRTFTAGELYEVFEKISPLDPDGKIPEVLRQMLIDTGQAKPAEEWETRFPAVFEELRKAGFKSFPRALAALIKQKEDEAYKRGTQSMIFPSGTFYPEKEHIRLLELARADRDREIREWAEKKKDKYKTAEDNGFNVGYNNAMNDLIDNLN